MMGVFSKEEHSLLPLAVAELAQNARIAHILSFIAKYEVM